MKIQALGKKPGLAGLFKKSSLLSGRKRENEALEEWAKIEGG